MDRKEEILQLLQSNEESTFFTLLEGPPSDIDIMIEIFNEAKNIQVKANAVEYIWKRGIKRKDVYSLLDNALMNENECLWQQALDGLVSFSSDEALEILKKALNNSGKKLDVNTFQKWINEAIDQITYKNEGLE